MTNAVRSAQDASGPRRWVYLELSLVVLLWGLVPLVMKLSAQRLEPGAFNLLRFLLATGLLFLFFRGEIARCRAREAGKAIVLGALTLFPFSYLFFIGVRGVDIAVAGTIQGLAPTLTLFLSVLLFQKPPTKRTFLGVGAAYCGLVLFFWGGFRAGEWGPTQFMAMGMLGLAIMSFSLYTLFSRRIGDAVPSSAITFYASIGAALMALPLATSEYMRGVSLPDAGGFAGCLYMALGATVISFVLYTKAVRTVGPIQASVFTNLVPVVIVLSGMLVLGEKLTLPKALGTAVVLGGVLMTILLEAR